MHASLFQNNFLKISNAITLITGAEVSARIYEILNAIAQSKESEFLILISDLNLNLNEAQYLQDKIQEHRL